MGNICLSVNVWNQGSSLDHSLAHNLVVFLPTKKHVLTRVLYIVKQKDRIEKVMDLFTYQWKNPDSSIIECVLGTVSTKYWRKGSPLHPPVGQHGHLLSKSQHMS